MLNVIISNLQELKDEMKTMRKLKTTSNLTIERRHKVNSYAREKAVKHNETLQLMYSTTSTFPVKVGGIIINYKLYQAFMRKLKGFEMRISITESSLALMYWKRNGSAKGILTLDDLTPYFENFRYVPVAELKKDVQPS